MTHMVAHEMEDDMRIALHDIDMITTDTSSDDVMDHGMTIVMKSGMGIIVPYATDGVFMIELLNIDQRDTSSDWELYLVFKR